MPGGPGTETRFVTWAMTGAYATGTTTCARGQQLRDGVVGEVIFPNTIPPFFPSFVLSAPPPKPEDYDHRLAGIRAHNRWLVDFCAALSRSSEPASDRFS